MSQYLINNSYFYIEEKEAIKVLNQEEVEFYQKGSSILYNAGFHMWVLKNKIDSKIIQGLESGKIKALKKEPFKKLYNIYVISDDLGTRGIVNPVNGKKYDSKSEYYKTVKAAGMEIAGTDAKVETRREIQGDFDCRREIAQAIEQTGAMEKLKGKK